MSIAHDDFVPYEKIAAIDWSFSLYLYVYIDERKIGKWVEVNDL